MNRIEKLAYLYYRKSYQISKKNRYYVTIEKAFEFTITNCNIIMASQTSSLNIAIKNRKQSNIPVAVKDRRTY